MLFEIKAEKCVSCLACVRVCPAEAVAVDGASVSIVDEACTRCGMCVPACPHDAIATVGDLARATALAANSPALPIVFDAPTSWIRWTPRNGFKFVFRLPDKQKAARHAELDITFGGGKEPSLRGPLDQWILQLANPVTGKTETLAGFGKILTIEVSGTYACEIDSDVPEDERVILASVALADKVYNFRLQGPRETVEDWRDEFITLLKAARPK